MPGKPMLPKNPMGGPSGPGAAPMAGAGGGAGNEAAADAQIAATMQVLYKALQAYPLGSKKNAAVLNAIRALSSNFGKQEDQKLVPAAIQQMAMASKPAGPMSSATMPPIAPAPPGGAMPPGGPGAGAESPM